MVNVLICDSSKPSIVMTSEVFKDKIQGAIVQVAGTGAAALELLKVFPADMCVVDFDLPDVDGPALISAMRKTFSGPILMTAFPDVLVERAIAEELFSYNDASAFVPKPVTFEALSQKIDLFLMDKHRIDKRFDGEFPANLVAKAAGRGKRAPKAIGRVTNISMGGVCMELDGLELKVKKSQEVTLTISTPAMKKSKKTVPAKTEGPQYEAKVKGNIAWIDGKERVGIRFAKLSEIQRKEVLAFLRMTQGGALPTPIIATQSTD